jgi:Cu2+-exporting ATPase
MLISISLYSGVSGSLGKYFTWISFLLYIPVIIYSAIPFYANAYRSILQKSITIDVPVAFALIVGSTASLINLINGSTHVYFDSLSMFIFLLLSSRYVLQQTQKKALHSNYTIQFLTPSTVHRISNTGEVSDTKLQNINPGDLLLVRVGETIPVDGTVTEGFTHLNQSILTGESRLIKASVGDPVYAGCLNEESPIRVRADKTGNDTRIGKILNRVKNSLEMKPKIIDFTDRIAKYFIYSVMLLTIVAFIYYLQTGFQNAFEIALAVIVISCPWLP